MNSDQFHQAAREAVPGVWLKTAIEQTTGDGSMIYCCVTVEGDEVCRASSPDPSEAIRKLVAERARNRAEKIEAAKKLLDSIG